MRTALRTPDALTRWQQGHGPEVIASTPEEMTAEVLNALKDTDVLLASSLPDSSR